MPHTHFPDEEGKHQYAFGIEKEAGSCLGLLEGGLCSSYADKDEGLSAGRLFPLPPPLISRPPPILQREAEFALDCWGVVCVVVVVGKILIVFPAREVMI